MEPVNHWQPVTTEYQHELAPVMVALRSRYFGPEYQRILSEPLVHFGILCITAFYFVSAFAYFFFASVLHSGAGSDLASWLIERCDILLPFQIAITEGVPLGKQLSEAFLIVAVIALAAGLLWLLRTWYIRWITMCFSAAALIRIALILAAGKAAGLTTVFTLNQKQFLLPVAAAHLLIFCFLAFYPGVAEACDRRR